VSRVVCGYTGGQYESPTSSNKQDHSEALLIEFNPKQLTFNDLLVLWMQAHNPFEPQFRSALFPTSKEQREVIDKYLVMVQYLRPRDRVYVHIHAPTLFYRADDSFQKFLEKRSWPTQQHHHRRGSKGERRRDSSSSSLKAESKEHSSRSMAEDTNNNWRVSLMKGDDGSVSVSEGTDDDPPSMSVFGRWSKTAGQQQQQQQQPQQAPPTGRNSNRRSSRNMRGCLTLLAATNIVSTSHSAMPSSPPTTKAPRRVSTTEATSRMMDQLLDVK
jgi:peptide-methionine (S)-S-oxide reductase